MGMGWMWTAYTVLLLVVAALVMACVLAPSVKEWAEHTHKRGGKPGPMEGMGTREPPAPSKREKPSRFDVMG